MAARAAARSRAWAKNSPLRVIAGMMMMIALAVACAFAALLLILRLRRQAAEARLARAAADPGDGVVSMRETLLRRIDRYSEPRF